MTKPLEENFREVVNPHRVPTRFLPGCSIEIIDGFSPSQQPLHALFDFDGTLSLIREGWPDVMIPMMVNFLEQTESGESREQLREIVTRFVMELTGKQTIFQMLRLAEEIQTRGKTPLDPLEYKHKYHALLMNRIETRRESLRAGSATPDDMLVPGSLMLLQQLQARGVKLYLASGTDENYVKEEVELLGLDKFFGSQVYGAVDDFRSFSKAQVIQRILGDHDVAGSSLIGFGDGYVEIQNLREAGGIAIGVASDETHKSGQPDLWKRERLIAAGANLIIPDFQNSETLLTLLF